MIEEEYGIDDCQLFYSKLNLLFFFGKLPSVNHIKFTLEESGDAIGYTYINNRKGIKASDKRKFDDDIYYVINVDKGVIKNKTRLMEVLCHEMIHLWQLEEINFRKYTGDYSWFNTHNKSFVAKMNLINTLAKTEYGMDIHVGLTYKE